MSEPHKPAGAVTLAVRCNKIGCTASATHYPKVCFPAQRWARNAHPGSIDILLGLKLCEQHAKEFPVAEMLKGPNDKLVSAIKALAAPQNFPFDPLAAFVVPVGIDSPEASKYESAQLRKQLTGGNPVTH